MQSPFVITDEQVVSLLDWDLSLDAARETFRRQSDGRLLLTEPRVKRLTFPDGGRGYRVKGAAFADEGIAGLRASRVIILNSWPEMEFLGVLQEQTAYSWRVGAVTAVALEALARESFEEVCLFGAGRLARTTLQALAHRYRLGNVRVLSRTAASRQSFAESFGREGFNIRAVDDPEKAVSSSELVITMTSADEVVVRDGWVPENATVVSMGGGQELDFDLLDRAEAVFVDDLSGCLESGDLARAREAGRYCSGWITANIADLLAAPQQFSLAGPTVFIPRGMAAMDIMQAWRLVQNLRGQKK